MKKNILAALKRAAALGAFCVLSSISFIANAQSFGYTGNVQTFTASVAGYYRLKVWGAHGGNNSITTGGTVYGGAGGYAEGRMWLNQGAKLYVAVGGAGGNSAIAPGYASGLPYGASGGWNGGGEGGDSYRRRYGGGAGGGGATSITTSLINDGQLYRYANAKGNVLLVAGGGGGAGGWNAGGYGGGSSGQSVNGFNGKSTRYAPGGTQSSGYQFGKGAYGRDGIDGNSSCEGNGGGGGGWYGGNRPPSTYGDYANIGGGGGSGYVNTSKLSSTSMQNGIRSGNGYAEIYLDGFTVSYNYNGGSGSPSSVQNTTYVTLPSPHSRTGYSFAGWYDGGTWVGGSGGGYNVTKNVWLTAHWNINSYYLDLNGSGSAISNTGGISPAGRADVSINGSKIQSNVGDYWASHTYGTRYEIDLKEESGYTLNSISVTSEGANGSHSISGATVTGTIGAGQTTIVGNYSPNSYTVEYYTNDGTGTNGEGTKIASETWSYATEKTLQGQGGTAACVHRQL
jgi:hypothetical protein